MNFLLRASSYILHPLLMPLLGTLIYFGMTPRYVEWEVVQAKAFAVAIITIFIPIVTFFLLKNMNVVDTIHLKTAKERKVPLMLQCILLLLIIKLVFDPYETPELNYFFVGILFSAMTALVMVFFSIKISLHQMGIAGITMFLIALSIHFKINMLLWIALFFLLNGLVATARLHAEAHTYQELSFGFCIGLLPQLILLNFWL